MGDKKWMTPELKLLHRRQQREYFKHRKSSKWCHLNSKSKRLKKRAVQTFYDDFVSKMKNCDPRKWYSLAKKIGAIKNKKNVDLEVEVFEGIEPERCAELIAKEFALISNQYKPVDTSKLPSFRPAHKPLNVSEIDIYKRLSKQKKTRSILPMDLPDQIRVEFAAELANNYPKIE